MQSINLASKFLLIFGLAIISPFASAQNLATDPLVRQMTDRANWEPGGRYFGFSDRGVVTQRSGQINTTITSAIRMGNLSIQSAVISGHIGYVNSFSGHGWEQHAPFDNVASQTDSVTNQRADGSSTSVSLGWIGTENHPANGYDGPQGGGYPAPAGARDIYNYSISGSAFGTYLLSSTETQALDTAPNSNRQQNYPENWYDYASGSGINECLGSIACLPRSSSYQTDSAGSWWSAFVGDVREEYGNRPLWQNVLSPVGGLGNVAAQYNFSNQYQSYLSRDDYYNRAMTDAEASGNNLAYYYYLTGSGLNTGGMYVDAFANGVFATASEMISPIFWAGEIKSIGNGLQNIGKGGVELAADLRNYYKSLGAVTEIADASKSLTPTVIRQTEATAGTLGDAAFAQVASKPGKDFSQVGQEIYSQLAGRPINTVEDLTNALKEGVIKPSQVPLDYVIIDGQKVISNTRTSTALSNAGIPKTEWYGVNKTGQTAYEGKTFDNLVQDQLNNNYGGSAQNARK